MFASALGRVCVSDWHWLSTSSDSFFSCWCCFSWRWSCDGVSFWSSLMLLWSDGVEGFEDDTVGATAVDISSVNMDKNCSSSNLSNSLLVVPDPGGAVVPEPRHSSSTGASRKVIESLTDLRWDPRLADEKSRNSSTQEGFGEEEVVVAVVLLLLPIEASFWCEMSCQFGVMFGILGGNCAMTHKNDSTQPNPTNPPNQMKWQSLTETRSNIQCRKARETPYCRKENQTKQTKTEPPKSTRECWEGRKPQEEEPQPLHTIKALLFSSLSKWE